MITLFRPRIRNSWDSAGVIVVFLGIQEQDVGVELTPLIAMRSSRECDSQEEMENVECWLFNKRSIHVLNSLIQVDEERESQRILLFCKRPSHFHVHLWKSPFNLPVGRRRMGGNERSLPPLIMRNFIRSSGSIEGRSMAVGKTHSLKIRTP